MDTISCRCGAPAACACVDLLDFMCSPCWDAFDRWCDTKGNDVPFSDWPGRVAKVPA